MSTRRSSSTVVKLPVSSYQYRTIAVEPIEVEPEKPTEPQVVLSERAFAERLKGERAAGSAEAEARVRQEFQQKLDIQTARVSKTIADFAQVQKDYFSRVESEVVQLALTIAGKILHREAQVDPLLISALVHLALGQLKEGSSASIRIRPEQAQRWHEHIASLSLKIVVKVVEDADLAHGDCVLETELGMVNFSLDAQLKEVERGFFDVLAQTPRT